MSTKEVKIVPVEQGKPVNLFWKYLGAMMTEMKNGTMAVSFTRVLGIVTFLVWVIIGILDAFQLKIGEAPVEMPSYVTYVLLALIGGKSLKDAAQAIKGNDSYTSNGVK